ncbi:hypothetical protein LPJ54_000497 [Coemansia sp. RSA 1824]|nr:hypothetical protein LPJ54_000497 [Coemansia sp. RSA 1824]
MHSGFLSTPNTGAHNGRPNPSFAHGTPYPHSSGGQADPRLHHSMPPGGYQQQTAGHMGAGPQQGGGYPATAAADIQEVILEDNMVVTITVNTEEATAATVVVMAVDTVVAMADMELDHQYTSDPVPMHGYHGGHGMGGHGMGGHGMGGHGMGGHGMGGHGMGGHSAMGMGGHGRPGMHPAASMVSIAHDPHGMFSHPSNMSRMHMGHGRAHFSSKSIPATCPRCKHDIMTLVRRRPNVLNVAASTGAVVAGLIFKLPVALLPLAMLPLQVKALQPKDNGTCHAVAGHLAAPCHELAQVRLPQLWWQLRSLN